MAVPINDDVVMDVDAEAARDFNNPLRHFDVGARRCRVASGVVVQRML
jgi:hypothetical protein